MLYYHTIKYDFNQRGYNRLIYTLKETFHQNFNNLIQSRHQAYIRKDNCYRCPYNLPH